MSLSLEQAIGQKLMLSFVGHELPREFLATLHRQHVGGVTLFRHHNVANPPQVRALTAALQRAAQEAGQPPLLIAADQEGGQLMAIGNGTTPFPGNMALGAARSDELARRGGYAIGRELAAMGLNVNYAPVCDVNNNPQNPVVGTRSFGEDPAWVARLSAAMVEGLQSAGVAAAAKHFPGHGDTAADSHHRVPVLLHDEARLRSVELPPFAAAVKAGARLVMTAHVALPALEGGVDLPATLSPTILRGLLRNGLGFDGLIITDALDMRAIQQGPGLAIDAIAAVAAGVDLLVLSAEADLPQSLHAALLQAAQRLLLSTDELMASAERILSLKRWASAQAQPSLDVVGCAEHRALALEVAARAVTLVRDTAGQLPLRLPEEARVAAVIPQPADLTPADTSSYVTPSLAHALRRYHSRVDEFVTPLNPADSDVAALREQLGRYQLVIIGTINAAAHPGQAALVAGLIAGGIPTVAVALRLPYDLAAYPSAPTYLCTYSILESSMDALARALWGEMPIRGRLPASIPGMSASGQGMERA
jgi:beta-N-acetylhexosaminidase